MTSPAVSSTSGSLDEAIDMDQFIKFDGKKLEFNVKLEHCDQNELTVKTTFDMPANYKAYYNVQPQSPLDGGPDNKRQSLKRNSLSGIPRTTQAAVPGYKGSRPMLMQRAVRSAMLKLKQRADPWEEFRIDQLPVRKATRHRYNVKRKSWVTDVVLIKMEDTPFAAGAMRNCYRLKKLSTIQYQEWKNADNYVAKKYIDKVERDVYFEDVRLQMDAKVWGEQFNKQNPPKQICIFQMCILEFEDTNELYHLEHFIEGDYIKYNSNSGFVDDSLRFTPHAFSHFTFEHSGHKLIVVDIQGVGDLYTDPQIHTSDGRGYGDGNLGTKGMALFFHSHTCNPICEMLNLSKFNLSEAEQSEIHQQAAKSLSPAITVVIKRQRSESSCCSLSPTEHGGDRFSFSESFNGSSSLPTSPEENGVSPTGGSDSAFKSSPRAIPPGLLFKPRVSHRSDSFLGSPTSPEMDEHAEFGRQYKPSTVFLDDDTKMDLEQRESDEVLGEIHLELAKYHELGRFSNQGDIDERSALYHLEIAAHLGNNEATKAMAQILLQKDNDILPSIMLPETPSNTNKGIGYMIEAAEGGDRSAQIFMAQAFETGYGLGTARQKNWKEAARFYEQAINTATSSSGIQGQTFDSVMHEPVYKLTAALAALYHQGGFGLDKDPSYAGDLYNEAADTAMSQFKGQLATKYYELAEIAWGEVEEE